MVTVHCEAVPAAAQAPPQPANSLPGPAIAVSVTIEPEAKLPDAMVQLSAQRMEAGALTIVPVPVLWVLSTVSWRTGPMLLVSTALLLLVLLSLTPAGGFTLTR